MPVLKKPEFEWEARVFDEDDDKPDRSGGGLEDGYVNMGSPDDMPWNDERGSDMTVRESGLHHDGRYCRKRRLG